MTNGQSGTMRWSVLTTPRLRWVYTAYGISHALQLKNRSAAYLSDQYESDQYETGADGTS